MNFIFDLFKKILKITILYIIIGFVAVLIISFSGAFNGLIIKDGLGEMALSEYVMLMGYAELLWLPLVVGILFSKVAYFPNPAIKVLLAVVTVLFYVSVIAIASKE